MWLASTARIFTAGRMGFGRMELLWTAEGGTDDVDGRVAGDLLRAYDGLDVMCSVWWLNGE